jgi:hypothetical protein
MTADSLQIALLLCPCNRESCGAVQLMPPSWLMTTAAPGPPCMQNRAVMARCNTLTCPHRIDIGEDVWDAGAGGCVRHEGCQCLVHRPAPQLPAAITPQLALQHHETLTFC